MDLLSRFLSNSDHWEMNVIITHCSCCFSNSPWSFYFTYIKPLIYVAYMFQFSSVAQSCPTLCDPMNRSTPGLPVHHQLLEPTQTYVHWVGDAIRMPSCHLILCRPLLLLPSIFPSARVFSNGSVLLIRWPKYWSFSFSVSSPMSIQDWSPLGWTGWISLQSKGLSRVFSNTTLQKHQFFSAQLSL